MPNEWNNFFDKFFNAGGIAYANISKNTREEEAKEKSHSVYQTAMENIKKSLAVGNQEIPGTETGEAGVNNPINDAMKTFDATANNPFGNLPPAELNSGALQDELIKPRETAPGDTSPQVSSFDALMTGLSSLVKLGDAGKEYIPLLETFYTGNQPKEVKKDIRESNGQFIDLTDPNNPKVLYGEKKPDKNTVSKYNKMTLEEAEQLTDNELSGDAFYYLPPDVQTQLMAKYPALQQMHDSKFNEGDFSPKIPGSRVPRSGPKMPLPPGDKTSQTLGEQLYKIRKEIEARGSDRIFGTDINDTGPNALTPEELKLRQDHDAMVTSLKGYGVNDWVSWSENIGNGTKVEDAKKDQEQFNQDYKDVVFSTGGIYDNIIHLYEIDSSTPEGWAAIQAGVDALYKWIGDNIYRKVDYPLEKAIYDYTNAEVSKLWNSKSAK